MKHQQTFEKSTREQMVGRYFTRFANTPERNALKIHLPELAASIGYDNRPEQINKPVLNTCIAITQFVNSTDIEQEDILNFSASVFKNGLLQLSNRELIQPNMLYAITRASKELSLVSGEAYLENIKFFNEIAGDFLNNMFLLKP